jgi:hypothetical protein
MASKPTGLAAFSQKSAPTSSEGAQTPSAAARRRGRGKTVALTVRLSRADWERLHQLAVSEGTSIQHLAVSGLSTIFAAKGLPALKS